MSEISFAAVCDYLQNLQKEICAELGALDNGANFEFDHWEKDKNAGLSGFGASSVIKNGELFEKGGVNFSCVEGKALPPSASAQRSGIAGKPFKAAGVSLVIHPNSPLVPTSHANVRFFMAGEEDDNPTWWFGGGYDLTPFYPFDDDCVHWHEIAKQACDPFGAEVYPKYKKWCDDYFYLKHRDEQRGVGGLFFDDLNEAGFQKSFDFMQAIGNSFTQAYVPIVKLRQDLPYTQAQRDFQLQRRGRYVEFNLVFDRGTLFGLQSGGRTESILMSMPPLVSWDYCPTYPEGSPEERLTSYYLKPRDWVKS